MALDAAQKKGSYTFIWKIENFSHYQDRDVDLKSPCFTVDSLNKTRWSLVLKGMRIFGNTFEISLCCEDWKNCDYHFDYQLSLVAADNSITNRYKNAGFTCKNSLYFPPSRPYNRKEIFETKRSLYLPQDSLTVLCRLWKTYENIEDIHCFARTRIEVQTLSKLWRIQDFSKLKMGYQKITTVSLAEKSYTPIVLKAFLERKVRNIYLIIQINREAVRCPYMLSSKISVLDHSKTPFKKIQDKRECSSKKELSLTFDRFITKNELMEQGSLILPQDELSLKFEFTLSLLPNYEKIESTHYGSIETLSEGSIDSFWNAAVCSLDCSPSDSEVFLKTDLLSLYQDQTLSDFELRSEGVRLHVHKAILCARSPVFKAMLTSSMQEVTTNCLQVTDIDPDTMARLLYYVYTDTVEDLELDSASKLFYASDKYEILSLKQKCSSALESYLGLGNVSAILLLADRHQDDELKSAVYDFIASYDKEIMQSAEWVEFDKTYSQLAAKTMYEVYKRKIHR